jgi:mono/diheme cytochrome c family protein
MLSTLLPRVSAVLVLAVVAIFASTMQAQPARPSAAPARGQLLYDAHCIECHNAQIHWRTAGAAYDWDSLRAQVDHWQGAASLGWSEDDILEVTSYLNETIYKFAVPRERASR